MIKQISKTASHAENSMTDGVNFRRYTDTYLVVADATDSAWDVMTDSQVPQIADGHPDDVANVVQVTPRTVEPRVWEIEVVYETGGTVAVLPTQRPWEVEWVSGEDVLDDSAVDADDKPVVNSAGQLFDPGLDRPVLIPTLVITRNESSFSAPTAMTYCKKTNQFPFYGAQPGQALMYNIRSTRFPEFGVYWWRTTYEIRFREDGWNKKFVDVGYCELVGGKWRQILDEFGNPVSAPVRLDGAGRKLAPGSDSVFFKTYKRAKEVDLRPLALEI